jgi:hypothetical protein
MDATINLADKKLYLAQLDKLHQKLKLKGMLGKKQSDGLTFFDYLFSRNKVCRILAKLVSKQKYLPRDSQSEKLHFKNKKRMVCNYSIADKIVQGVLFEYFSKAQEAYLSKNVYSYMKSRHAHQVIEAFANYLKNKTLARSIYVFHADIFAYSDALPVADTSPLWQQIKELSQKKKNNADYDYIDSLIKKILRPILYTKEGCPYQNLIGIPMGSPFALLANNIYLKPVDDALLTIPDLFYARYCDQFILAHTDITIYKHAQLTLLASLNKLYLSLNERKIRNIDLKVNENSQIELLGFNIDSSGDISTNNHVLRSLARNIFIRMNNCANLLTTADLNTKGKLLCATVNTMLDPKHELCEPLIKQLRYTTHDKTELNKFDEKICLKIAELCSGISDKKALDVISCQKIHDEWGLIKCH